MALIKCPECGREVSDRAAACPGCGFALGSVKRCEECGEILPSGAAVCPKCGLPVDTANAPAAAAAQPAPTATVTQPAPVSIAKAAPPAPTAATANAQSAPAPSQNGVLVEGNSGVINGRIITGIVMLAIGVLAFIWSANFTADPSTGLPLVIFSIYSGILQLRGSKGDNIRVTQNTVSGNAFNRRFDCSLGSVTSVTRNAKNAIVLTIISEKGKNKKYKVQQLPNHEEVYNVLNSLIASKGQR